MKSQCDVNFGPCACGQVHTQDNPSSMIWDLKDTRIGYVHLPDKDPSGLDAKAPGAKLDAGKPKIVKGCLHYFPDALAQVARLSEIGAKKYSWKGWQHVDNGVERYTEALMRHLVLEDVEEFDVDLLVRTGDEVKHAVSVAWNALARLQLILTKETTNEK